MHTLIFLGTPLIMALTFCMLGDQVLLVRIWEWESWMPVVIPLPQTSHLAMEFTSLKDLTFTIIPKFSRVDK